MHKHSSDRDLSVRCTHLLYSRGVPFVIVAVVPGTLPLSFFPKQYDDREVDVGGGGLGGDVEAIRRVNQLVRQEEEEDAWWENNKNNNLRSVRARVVSRPGESCHTNGRQTHGLRCPKR